MDIVIVDQDASLSRLLQQVLSSDGYVIRVIQDLRAVQAILRSQSLPLLVLTPGEMVGKGLDLLAGIGAARPAHIFLILDRADPVLEQKARQQNIDQIFYRPFSFLDFADAVRKVCHRHPPASPDWGRPTHDNLMRLGRLWARRVTGVLSVRRGERTQMGLMQNGGTIGVDGWEAVEAAVEGGDMSFEPCEVEGRGDRRRLGYYLMNRLGLELAETDLSGVRRSVLAPGPSYDALPDLPMSPSLSTVVRQVDGRVTTWDLLERSPLPAGEVLLHLAILLQLGVLQQDFAKSNPALSSPVTLVPPSSSSRSVSSDVLRRETLHRSDAPWSEAPRSAAHSDSLREALRSELRDHRSGGAPISAPVEDIRSTITGVPPSAEGSAPSGRSALGPALRRAGVTGADEQLRKRLASEVQILESQSAWTVLGIPARSPEPLIRQAQERMNQRYGKWAQHDDPEIRRLAETMLERIRDAVLQLQNDISYAGNPEAPDEQAFLAGIAALTRNRWADADRFFQKARDLNLSSARNLAFLGWARVHNPTVPAADREDDGLGFLREAERMDAQYPETHYFMAVLLQRRGDNEGAVRRLRKVLEVTPTHADALSLMRRLTLKPTI